METLLALKASEHKIGLISNCTAQGPLLGGDTPVPSLVEVPIVSAFEGMAKPGPCIYHLAGEGLAVALLDCLYVGDGASHELAGSQKVGMYPVLIRVQYDDPNVPTGPRQRTSRGP